MPSNESTQNGFIVEPALLATRTVPHQSQDATFVLCWACCEVQVVAWGAGEAEAEAEEGGGVDDRVYALCCGLTRAVLLLLLRGRWALKVRKTSTISL